MNGSAIGTFGASLGLSLVLVAVAAGSATQRPGSLDASFGNSGTVVTTLTAGGSNAFGIKALSSRKLLVVGAADDSVSQTNRFLLARYLPSGTLDASFGKGGITETGLGRPGAAGFALALQPDQKIVVAGVSATETHAGFGVARYLPNGSLDPTFGAAGTVTTDFGTDPGDYASSVGVAVQQDGKIVVVGNDAQYDGFLLVRYQPDGSLDPSFGENGAVLTRFSRCPCEAYALALQRNGRVLVGGSHEAADEQRGGFTLARYLPNGSLDPGFGNNGVAFTVLGTHTGDYSYIAGLALQPNGMIIAGGGSDHQREGSDTSNFALARYKRNGSLDRSFGRQGWRETGVPGTSNYVSGRSVARQKDGSILLAGTGETQRNSYDFVLARYLPTGSLDRSFGDDGTAQTDFAGGADLAFGLALQPRGRIILAGVTRLRGERDSSVGLAGYLRGRLHCLVPPTRGKKLIMAKRLIRKARCSVGSIRQRYSPRVGFMRVISERPHPFSSRPFGAKVRIVVSKGARK